MPNSEFLELQAFYTMAELAQRTSTSSRRIRRLLHHSGIPSHRVGGQRLVFTSDIEAHMPQLWASMIACERARAISRALESMSARQR